jgi:hypothetical protein
LPPPPASASDDQRRFNLWQVPTAVWLYGFLRALAFAVPYATGTGGFGLGVVVIGLLFIWLVRGSRVAWAALVVLDVISFVLLLLATPQLAEAPLILHILAGLALLTLLLPSTRRYVRSDGSKASA